MAGIILMATVILKDRKLKFLDQKIEESSFPMNDKDGFAFHQSAQLI